MNFRFQSIFNKSNFRTDFIPFYVKLFLFWIAIFDIQRVFFILLNQTKIPEGYGFYGVFTHSLTLDIATAAYLSVLPLTSYLFYRIFQIKVIYFITLGIIGVELILSNTIHCAEIIVYEEWKHKLTSKVFIHLFNGNEVLRTAENNAIIWFYFYLIFECIIGVLLGWFLFRNHRSFLFIKSWKYYLMNMISFLFEIGFCLVFARGGFQQIPINIDAAYFNRSFILNDISINSTYYFANSYLLYLKSDIERFVPKIDSDIARHHADSLYRKEIRQNKTFLNTRNPNVVVVILEGWSASALQDLANLKNYHSKFKGLKNQGIYFDNIYATNTTSEIGHTSILSGFPSIAEIAISQYPEKHRKLTTMNQLLSPMGYSSSYLFGGDAKYGNIESFIVDHSFDKITDEDDFPSGLSHGKLSYHDEDVFQFFIDQKKTAYQPFFSVIFTGSTHSPYDYPSHNKYTWQGKEKAYMNSLIYAENALFDFIEKAKMESWYDQTLFVFISDHSHSSPSFEVPYASGFFKIPLLFYGKTIQSEFHGTTISTIGSQADLPATLLNQLGVSSRKMPFSKDLTDQHAHHFSMLATIRGYGFVNKKGSFMFHFDYNRYNQNSFSESDFLKAKKDSDALFRSYYDYYDQLDDPSLDPK